MRTVYRLACPNNFQRGFYSIGCRLRNIHGIDDDTFTNPFRCPVPEDDGLHSWYDYGPVLFGFASIEAALEWFGDYRAPGYLKLLEDCLAFYEVDTPWEAIGDSGQVIFLESKVEEKRKLPISKFIEMLESDEPLCLEN